MVRKFTWAVPLAAVLTVLLPKMEPPNVGTVKVTGTLARGFPLESVTKTSKGDPTSRFYTPDSFDVVAACMYGPTRAWTFRFRRSVDLLEHPTHPGRIAPLQRITNDWASSLVGALDG